MGNYRPITLLCLISKLFECILNGRLYRYVESNDLLSELQGGFRAGRSCLDQAWLLNEIVADRKERGEDTYLIFLDVRKAYDTVWREGLYVKLYECGITGRVWRLIQAMNVQVIRTVIVGQDQTDPFQLALGVAQGGVLSPLLYDIFIDGLLRSVEQSGVGAIIAGRQIGVLAYADDLVLVARSKHETDQLMDIVLDYARKWRFSFNADKCAVIINSNGKRSASRSASQDYSTNAAQQQVYVQRGQQTDRNSNTNAGGSSVLSVMRTLLTVPMRLHSKLNRNSVRTMSIMLWSLISVIALLIVHTHMIRLIIRMA